MRRERRTPVLLGVAERAIQPTALDPRAQHVRVPVLRQAGDDVRWPERPKGPVRPPDPVGEAHIEAGALTEVDAQPLVVAHQDGACPHAEAAPVRARLRDDHRAQQALGMAGQRNDRPPPLRAGAHAAQNHHHAPARQVDDPPVVALHYRSVITARVAERRIGAQAPVGPEEHRQGQSSRSDQITTSWRAAKCSSGCSSGRSMA